MMKNPNVNVVGEPMVPVPPRESVGEDRKGPGLNEKLNHLLELMGEDPQSLLQKETAMRAGAKVRPFRLPGRVRSKMKRGIKKGKALVIYVKDNRAMLPVVAKVQDGRFFVDGAWHAADPNALFMWGGKLPCFIQPAWSINPVKTWDTTGKVDVGNSADAERVLLDIFEHSDVLDTKKKSGGMMKWVIGGFAVVAVIYLIFGGGV